MRFTTWSPLVTLLGVTLVSARPVAAQDRVSRLGVYQGYSEASYDGSVRESQ